VTIGCIERQPYLRPQTPHPSASLNQRRNSLARRRHTPQTRGKAAEKPSNATRRIADRSAVPTNGTTLGPPNAELRQPRLRRLLRLGERQQAQLLKPLPSRTTSRTVGRRRGRSARGFPKSSKAAAALRLQDRRGSRSGLTPSSQLPITSPANDSEWSLSQSRRSGRLAEAVSGAVEIRPTSSVDRGDQGVPLSRISHSELHRCVIEPGVSDASASTIGRCLSEDPIRPGQYRSWSFPRDSDSWRRPGGCWTSTKGRVGRQAASHADFVICPTPGRRSRPAA
jgi:hypothetical protein